MAAVTSRELKNHTGAVLRRVRAGELVVVTNRGKPVAVLTQPPEERLRKRKRSVDEIWAEIDAALAATPPPWPTWQEAMRWARGR